MSQTDDVAQAMTDVTQAGFELSEGVQSVITLNLELYAVEELLKVEGDLIHIAFLLALHEHLYGGEVTGLAGIIPASEGFLESAMQTYRTAQNEVIGKKHLELAELTRALNEALSAIEEAKRKKEEQTRLARQLLDARIEE